MVRLKRTMNIYRQVTIREDMPKAQEAEVWIAVLRSVIALDSVNPLFDCLLYKENVSFEKIMGDEIRVRVLVPKKEFVLRFASKESLQEFYNTATEVLTSTSNTPSPPPML